MLRRAGRCTSAGAAGCDRRGARRAPARRGRRARDAARTRSGCWSSSTRTRRRCPTGCKHLVVYALQGRYEVDGDRHRAPRATRSSCAARPPARATTSSSPSAATARSTRPPTGSPARRRRSPCLPGGSNNVVRQDARDPHRRRRRHRAPAAARRPLGAARGRPRARQRPLVHVRRRRRARRQRRRARRRQPAAQGALRPLVLRRGARSRRSCAATSSTRRGWRSRSTAAPLRGRERVRPERRAVHVLRRPRRSTLVEGARLDSGDLAGVVLTRARPVRRADGHVPRAVRRGPDRQAPRRSRVRPAFARVDGALASTAGPFPIQVDGDHIGDETRRRFTVGAGRAAGRQLSVADAAAGPARPIGAAAVCARRRSIAQRRRRHHDDDQAWRCHRRCRIGCCESRPPHRWCGRSSRRVTARRVLRPRAGRRGATVPSALDAVTASSSAARSSIRRPACERRTLAGRCGEQRRSAAPRT